MSRGDIGLGLVIGLGLAWVGVMSADVRLATLPFDLWFVGLGALVVAIVLRLRRTWPLGATVIGVVGVTWLTYVAAIVGLLVFAIVRSGGWGP
jgi:hypothetical protein